MSEQPSFFADILRPGSAFHPTFLAIVDGALATLLCVFLALLVMTRGNLHICALIVIELCLWASIKWSVKYIHSPYFYTSQNPPGKKRFVSELKKAEAEANDRKSE